MKCTSCKNQVLKIPANWKCPHCGEELPQPGAWANFVEEMIQFLDEKGTIFWSIWFGVLLIFIGAFEMMFGRGYLLTYLGRHYIFSIIFIFYGGMLIDMYARIQMPLRLPYGSTYMIRERAVIRNMRKLTNLALIVGLGICLFWLGPQMFFMYFQSYLLIIGWCLALSWAIVGLFIDPRWREDVRFRYFLEDRLFINSLKHLRKLSTTIIGTLIVVAIGYNVLLRIPQLWVKFSNLAIIGNIIMFIKIYFSWLY